MISLQQVWRWYPTALGRKYVLRDVSFTIPSGRNIGICGRNGAGKSTLMRLLSGSEAPNRGSIHVEGSLSWPLGLSGGVQPAMTGRENTKFVGWVHGLESPMIRQMQDFVHGFSELGTDFDLPVANYSAGMRSRLTFAISMAFEFDYYLLDEIGAPGDARFKAKSAAALAAKKGKSNFVLVSQNIAQLMREADVILVVDSAQVAHYQDLHAARMHFNRVMGST